MELNAYDPRIILPGTIKNYLPPEIKELYINSFVLKPKPVNFAPGLHITIKVTIVSKKNLGAFPTKEKTNTITLNRQYSHFIAPDIVDQLRSKSSGQVKGRIISDLIKEANISGIFNIFKSDPNERRIT